MKKCDKCRDGSRFPGLPGERHGIVMAPVRHSGGYFSFPHRPGQWFEFRPEAADTVPCPHGMGSDFRVAPGEPTPLPSPALITRDHRA